jgi:quinoprotein glucose dehydrogenase
MTRAPAPALAALAAAFLACSAPAPVDDSGPTAEWPAYGGDAGGMRWSPLTQITRDNVGDLEVAWEHHSGDVHHASRKESGTSFNATPIVIDGTLYYCTAKNRVFALDAETGEQRWVFDPVQRLKKLKYPYPRVCRGVAYWKDTSAAPGSACARRIFTGTLDAELIAIDAETGRACEDFGSQGRVGLRDEVGAHEPSEYYVTSPPLAIRDVVVVGALIADNERRDAASGVVRAFDARSGALRWSWDPVPPGWQPPADFPSDGRRFTAGTANVWSILSGDEARGLVFAPTGNAAPDYFSASRHGLDYFSSSTVALDAATGGVRWRFQTVHHDVWDYDVPAQPTLVDLPVDGRSVPAVVQATKMGHVFLLDRDTGTPLYPVEERPVPATDVEGETLSPTQPFPTHPPPLHPARLAPEDAWGFTPWDRKKCAERIAELRSEGVFTPPSLRGSVEFPGPAGGPNWGGVSIDPVSHVMYVNQMHVAMIVKLIPRAEYDAMGRREKRHSFGKEFYPQLGTPYAVVRMPLLSPLKAPCNPPPWGTLTAVDLVSGRTLWESTLGTTRDQAPFPMWLPFGAPNLGGSIVTAGGVLFIGATTDKFVRAFDAKTGEELWTRRVPFTANATPMTYRLRKDGRQFLVIAAGGHGWSESGDALLAFALPR